MTQISRTYKSYQNVSMTTEDIKTVGSVSQSTAFCANISYKFKNNVRYIYTEIN